MSSDERKAVRGILGSDVTGMFNEIVGQTAEDVNLKFAVPKYVKIKMHARRFVDVLEVFRKSPFMKLFPQDLATLEAYIAAREIEFSHTFSAPSEEELCRDPADDSAAKDSKSAAAKDSKSAAAKDSKSAAAAAKDSKSAAAKDSKSASSLENLMFAPDDDRLSRVSQKMRTAFGVVYRGLDKSPLIGLILKTCVVLKNHESMLSDARAPKDDFMHRPGVLFFPVASLKINIKQLYIDKRLSLAEKKTILTVLSKLFTISRDLNDAMMEPDVDVDEFIQLITDAIEELKPRVPRCGEAFARILDSVRLLKTNFTSYYGSFVVSGNPSVIVESFVSDVSRNTEASPLLAKQFNDIIRYYRKQIELHGNDPKMTALFSQAQKNFGQMGAAAPDAEAQVVDELVDVAAPADAKSATADAKSATAASAGAAAAAPSRLAKKRAKQHAKKAPAAEPAPA